MSESRVAVGSRNNLVDSIEIKIVQTPYVVVERRIVARLDANLKAEILHFAAKCKLNLIIG